MYKHVDLHAIHTRMHAAAQHFRLPVQRRAWQGRTGHVTGVGIGNSIEFQDHRPYAPGDDPRQIDWRAYARTEQYLMKMHREEVSPKVDVVLDASRSMALEEDKWTRVLELLYFAIESGRAVGASLRCTFLDGYRAHEWPAASLLAYQLPTSHEHNAGAALDLKPVRWRYGSLRIVISDLLFPGEPDTWLTVLRRTNGHGILLVPYSRSETDPAWSGHLRLVDCETQTQRKQRISPELMVRSQQQYARHFALWQEACTRYAWLLARVPSHLPFDHAMQAEAVRVGAVELCNF